MLELKVENLNEAEIGIALDEAALRGLDVRAGDTILITGGPKEYTLRVASPATLDALPHMKDVMSRFAPALLELKD